MYFGNRLMDLLEGQSIGVVQVNPLHVRGIIGRKSDKADARRLAELLLADALRASFRPTSSQKELRLLTRSRVQAVEMRTKVKNQIHKLLRDAGIVLDTVLSDIFGQTGRRLIDALAHGCEPLPVDPAERNCVLGRIARAKREAVADAIDWTLTATQQLVLRLKLAQLDSLDVQIAELETATRTHIAEQPGLPHAVERLDSIPGIGELGATGLLAEIGADMSRFKSAGHLCSWAGICPGTTESGGKRLSGRCAKGNRHVRRLLGEFANTLRRKPAGENGMWLHLRYRSLAGRIGWKKAVVATAHTILRLVYAILKTEQPYEESRHRADSNADRKLLRRLIRQAHHLGYGIDISRVRVPQAAPADPDPARA